MSYAARLASSVFEAQYRICTGQAAKHTRAGGHFGVGFGQLGVCAALRNQNDRVCVQRLGALCMHGKHCPIETIACHKYTRTGAHACATGLHCGTCDTGKVRAAGWLLVVLFGACWLVYLII